MSPQLLPKDARTTRRLGILLAFFFAFLIALAVFHGEIDRRLLAWKTANGVGGFDRLFELAGKGPRMIPYIEPYLEDEDPQVRFNAAMALKAMQHPGCLPVFHRMARSDDRDLRLMGLDGMAETVQLGVFPVFVEGLRDPDERIRWRCSTVLEELTGETFGYDARGPEAEREAAVKRWEAFLRKKEASRMGEVTPGE